MEKEMVQQIKNLMFSADSKNVKMALQIMESNREKLSIEDITEILCCVYVEGGTYKMGETPEQDGNTSDEYPVHDETVPNMYACQYTCWQALWQAVTDENPSYNQESGLHPVEQVSWNDVQEKFINWMNEHIIPKGYKMILPTEAEWEYLARGGKLSKGYKYAGSNNIDEIAWHAGNSDGHTHPVGTKKPNELGLFDMTSNVLTWCQNWYEPYNK